MSRWPKQKQTPAEEQESQKHVLKDRHVAREYPVTIPWLKKTRKRIRAGELDAGPAFVQSGRSIFYRREAIEIWLRAHEIGGTAAK
jgi:hypothetical protein